MKLFYREYGKGRPVIIAHGLFAMSDSWIPITKQLSKSNKVYILDLRNHGQSPHSKTHTYKAMSNDFFEFMNALNISKATFIGHSMGGKAVMQFANDYPEKVDKMVIVDVLPMAYVHDKEFVKRTINHKLLLEVLQTANLKDFKNRKEIINYFTEYFNNFFILQLIQKNITKNNEGDFVWKININAIYSNLNKIIEEIKLTENVRNVKTMFVFGEISPYFSFEDKHLINKHFANTKIELVKDAGHLLHIEKKDVFLKLIQDYIKK